MMQDDNSISNAALTSSAPSVPAHGLRLYLLIAIPMAVLLSLFYIIKSRAFAFVDIGSDTFFQFLPIQIAEAKQLQTRYALTWSFTLGLGAYIGSSFDPIRLLASSLFPESWQLGIRLPIYWSQVVIAGGFFMAYLRKLTFNRDLAILGALAYAFSSYTMINGQWDQYVFQTLQLAAYLYFIESFLRGGSRWNAVAAGLAVGLGQVFDIYTFSLLTLLYVSARLLCSPGTSGKNYYAMLLRYGCWAALGFALAAPIQLPNLHYLFDSPRAVGDHSALGALLAQIWQLNDRATIGSEVAGLFGKDLLGTGSSYKGWGNYLEGPGFYVGMLLLLCIPQLLAPAATRREKWMCVTGIGLLLAYILWPAIRFTVHAFGHIGFRVSTLWVSVGLLVMGLAGLRRTLECGPWRPGLLVGAIGILAILAAISSFLPQIVNVSQIVRVVGFVMVYVTILWLLGRRTPAPALLAMLLPIFACELLLFAAPSMIDRAPINSDGTSQYGSYDDGTEQALAVVRRREGDAAFYRVEKTYNSVFLCDALIQDYHGIKSYYFHGSSLTRFVDSMHLSRPVDSVSYIGSAVDRPLVLDLLGVKYLLSRDTNLDGVAGYSYVDTAGGVNIYQNKNARGFAQVHDLVVGESDVRSLTPAQRDDLLLRSVVVQDLAAVRSGLDQLNKLPPASDVLTASTTLRLRHETSLAGTVRSPNAAVLLVSVPFDIGWSAALDGAPVQTFQADYGLTALLVPPGTHDLTFNYEPPGRRLGQWLCLGSICVLIIFSLIRRKRGGSRALKRLLSSS